MGSKAAMPQIVKQTGWAKPNQLPAGPRKKRRLAAFFLVILYYLLLKPRTQDIFSQYNFIGFFAF